MITGGTLRLSMRRAKCGDTEGFSPHIIIVPDDMEVEMPDHTYTLVARKGLGFNLEFGYGEKDILPTYDEAYEVGAAVCERLSNQYGFWLEDETTNKERLFLSTKYKTHKIGVKGVWD